MAKANTTTTPTQALRNGITRAKKHLESGKPEKAVLALEEGECSSREIELQRLAAQPAAPDKIAAASRKWQTAQGAKAKAKAAVKKADKKHAHGQGS